MKKPNKLALNQETLRNLIPTESEDFKPTNNSCIKSVCFPICTPQGGIN